MTIFPPRRLNRALSARPSVSSPLISIVLGVTLWCVTAVHSNRVMAESPDTTPAELTSLLNEIEAAANRQDVAGVMEYYSSDFQTSDGLDRRSFEQILSQFWQGYSTVNYRTEVQSWKQEGSTLVVTTVTEITGKKTLNEREYTLTSTITSQQRVENQKVVQQDILAERNQLTSGVEPPTVTLNLPEEVKVGEDYSVDAIVLEPLGNEILLGTAVEERITPRAYFTTLPLQFEFLASGGIFKIGTAPKTAGNNWVSAVLLRQGGITLVTQRLRIVE